MEKYTNNAVTQTATTLNPADTTLALPAGQGALFPSLGADDWFMATLVDDVGNLEIVKVTSRVTDSLVIVRAQEGTTAQYFPTGSIFSHRLTAQTLNALFLRDGSTPMTGPVDFVAGADLASAATVDLGLATGNSVHITGTNSITSFGTTAQNGVQRTVRFSSALTLTHLSGGGVAGDISLPGAANIVTQSGDTATFVKSSPGVWECSAYTRADGRHVGQSYTTLASAGTVAIGSSSGDYINVTGTTTITSFGGSVAGAERELRFSGALILTHNAVSLILPSGANITTAAGDVARFRSEGGVNWRCVSYTRADGTALIGGTVFASAAENAAGTVENKSVDPLGIREAFNATGSAPVYACRAWCRFNGSGTLALLASGNVTSVTDNGTGDYTVNFTTAMPDANYAAIITDNSSASNVHISPFVSSANLATYILAGSMRFSTYAVTGSIQDSANIYFSAYR